MRGRMPADKRVGEVVTVFPEIVGALPYFASLIAAHDQTRARKKGGVSSPLYFMPSRISENATRPSDIMSELFASTEMRPQYPILRRAAKKAA